MDSDFAMIKMIAPKALVGTPLGESPVRSKYQVTVGAIKHANGDDFAYATAQTALRAGDVIYVFGRTEQIERFNDELS